MLKYINFQLQIIPYFENVSFCGGCVLAEVLILTCAHTLKFGHLKVKKLIKPITVPKQCSRATVVAIQGDGNKDNGTVDHK